MDDDVVVVTGDDLSDQTAQTSGMQRFVKPNVVHWEENVSDTEPVRMIVARTTQDAIVVNLDDHPFAPEGVPGNGDPRNA